MIEINLLPVEFRKRAERKLKLPPLPTLRYFVMFQVGLAVIGAILIVYVIHEKAVIGKLEAERKILEPALNDIRTIKGETSAIQKKLKALRRMTRRPFYWTNLLNLISDELNDGLWLTRISIERKRIVETGPRSRKRRRDSDKKESKEKYTTSLIICGLADSKKGGTAAVAKYVQRLEGNNAYSEPFSHIWLGSIGRGKHGSNQFFEFTVNCLFKPESDGPSSGT